MTNEEITENIKGKQETVRDYLLNDIRRGILKPGDKLYSRSVFMKKFNCARGTIDQAIQSLIKAGSLTSEKGKGTFVAFNERGAISGQIAIIARKHQPLHLTGPILNKILEGIGNQFKFAYYTFDDLRHPATWQDCCKHSVLVFFLPDAEQEPFLIDARSKKIPHLAIYRDPMESPFVTINNVGGAENLITSLAKSGHKKIAFAAWRQSRYQFAEQIYTGYLKGLIQNQLPFYENLSGFCLKDNEEPLLKKIFNSEELPDALLFYGIPLDKIQTWVKKRKLTIGANLTLANYNYVKPGEYTIPMLSPIPVELEIGIEAAKQIKLLAKNKDIFPQIYITPQTEN
jgi:hypothetical protein